MSSNVSGSLERRPESSIDRVCWPVKRVSGYESRPVALVSALEKLGAISGAEFEYHGSMERESDFMHRSTLSTVRRSAGPRDTAVLSPLLLAAEIDRARWIDLYDDWTLAPEMRWTVRLAARRGYASMRRARGRIPLTVNSSYMRDRLSCFAPVVVPNAVDPEVASLRPSELDRVRRLIMIGNFFTGRTDWRLMEALCSAEENDEVLIFGATAQVRAMAARVNGRLRRPVVATFPKAPLPEIASRVGERTVVAVPHVVSDYTMSQDLMKVYQAAALGCRVVLPVELRPVGVPDEFMLTVGVGANLDKVLRFAYDASAVSVEEVATFVAANCWEVRARRVMEALSEV